MRPVHGECKGEQEAAQPVRPLQEVGRERLGLVERPELTFGASRDGARLVESGGAPRPPREDEALERTERLGESVGVGLEAPYVALADPVRRRLRRGRRGELALGYEDLVLEPEERLADLAVLLGELGRRASERGAELVVATDGADPRRVLPYAGAAQETGLAAVAGPGV